MIFGFIALLCSLILCNFTLYGGLNLGFGIAVTLYIVCSVGYLLVSGRKLTPYTTTLLVLCIAMAAGFGRSADSALKSVLVIALVFTVNLALCLIAGQNRRCEGSAGCIGDACGTVFAMGYGYFGAALGGFFKNLKGKEGTGKKIGAVIVGILVMLPVLGILLPLLTDADAAFEGLMRMIPELNLDEALITIIFGILLFCVLYSRNVTLVHRPVPDPAQQKVRKGINKLTINTVLIGVCLVYSLYLISQLAYFTGGFSGIVPKEYTLAEYARRGFGEMVVLCVLNMIIIILAEVLVRKHEKGIPLSTRLLCLFISLTTVFMAAAASAKMINYVGGYGLTRSRVIAMLGIVFIAVTALTVAVNLFLRKPRYMQVLVITALVLGTLAFWVDVDAVVASYNVTAYQKGVLAEVDLDYLESLSNGAIPHVAKLANDADPVVAKRARQILKWTYAEWEDFRDWNYADQQAHNSLNVSDPEDLV